MKFNTELAQYTNIVTILNGNYIEKKHEATLIIEELGSTAHNRLNSSDIHTDSGVYIEIPNNTVIDAPIFILNINKKEKDTSNIQQQNFIFCGENSKATIIEIHLDQNDASDTLSSILNYTSTNIIVDPNASIKHCLLCDTKSYKENNIAATIEQEANSTLSSWYCMLDGNHAKLEADIFLLSEGASNKTHLLESPNNKQIHDANFNIHHTVANCLSNSTIRSVVNDDAHGLFSGTIKVHKNATQTKADLQCKNLLLSKTAEVDSRPVLEIDNDDVQCSHGSTVGYLEQDALYYMCSRGIDKEEAKRMLIHSFVSPVIQDIPCQSLLNYITEKIGISSGRK